MDIYLVGGAVRDRLLGLPELERDYVVVGATIEEMLEKGFKPVGTSFPVFLHPDTHEEYALARTERKIAQGYHGFDFYAHPNVTLEEDLYRRDLTINAIALDEEGNIIDPYGGQKDLKQKILRHVSSAFEEDPVRILRLARFFARFFNLGFKIAEETLALAKNIVLKGEMPSLTAERVWQETYKALQEPHPEKYFECLRACSALKALFPEISRLFGIPQSPHSHPEIDVGIHTMMVVQQAAKLACGDAEIIFAALCHDLGKGATPKEFLPSHPDHETAALPIIRGIVDRFKIPNRFKELALIAAANHGLIHKADALQEEEILQVILKTDALRRPQRFKKLLIIAEADSKGRTGYENQAYYQAAFWQKVYATIVQASQKTVRNFSKNLSPIEKQNQLHKARIHAIKELKAGTRGIC